MKQYQPQKQSGMQVGSASLVMVFSVLCLTVFAVLSVVTAQNQLDLAEKTAQSVTAYYQADSRAVEILDAIIVNSDGTITMPSGCSGQVEVVDGCTYLSYTVPIDGMQELWVQLLEQDGALHVAHWLVRDNGTWTAQETLEVWGG